MYFLPKFDDHPLPKMERPHKSRIAVLTGGPGCGKTTLLCALDRLGMVTIPEAALQLINELNEQLGVEEQRAWRNNHFMEFQDMLIERQQHLEANVDQAVWNIADRSLLDIVGFCRFKGVAPPPKLTPQLLADRYGVAFLLEPLLDYADRRSTGRLFDRKEALAIGECLGFAYSGAGVPVIRVPCMTVGERAAYVVKHLTSPLNITNGIIRCQNNPVNALRSGLNHKL